MRFLADESCDFAVVTTLRAAGHDVTAVAEISPRAKDPTVLGLARSEARVLLTEDKDMLEDLVLAAMNDAVAKAQAATQAKMAGFTAGMGLPPGMGLPF